MMAVFLLFYVLLQTTDYSGIECLVIPKNKHWNDCLMGKETF